MHSSEPRIRDVYYGADSDNLYLRLDADDEFRFHTLEVRTEDQTVSLLENPAFKFAGAADHRDPRTVCPISLLRAEGFPACD